MGGSPFLPVVPLPFGRAVVSTPEDARGGPRKVDKTYSAPLVGLVAENEFKKMKSEKDLKEARDLSFLLLPPTNFYPN